MMDASSHIIRIVDYIFLNEFGGAAVEEIVRLANIL